MYFQVQPFSRLMSRIFSVVSVSLKKTSLPYSGHLLGAVARAAPRDYRAYGHRRGFSRAGTHHRNVARIELLPHLGEKGTAAADEEIDDVIARRIVERLAVDVGARALLGQRILDNLGENGVGPVGHQHDPVG